MTTPETRLKRKCYRWLDDQPDCYYVNTSLIGGGCPDTLLCCRGMFVAVEFKGAGEVPTARQNAVMAEIVRAKGAVAVVYKCTELQEIVESIRR